MKTEQYRKIAEHPLRQIFRNMVQDARDLPTRSQVKEAIDSAVPEGTDHRVKDALFTKAIELAQKAQAEGRESWFDLRGAADRLVLHAVESFEDAERILPREDADAEDVSGALDAVDSWDPTAQRMQSVQRALKADEAAANAARQRAGH
jgi:hypothetical protein